MSTFDPEPVEEASPAEPTEPGEGAEADDTSGHSMLTYEFARVESRERSKEAARLARQRTLGREARGLIDRLKKR
ncbi:MAG TPA: hypothetical protein VIV06_01705 [Candidatus Limnocylindrales bacterium]